MHRRFAFRQVDYRDIQTFITDREIRSKNNVNVQRCYQTSYPEIVNRRNEPHYHLPNGGVVNDYVAFYLSPYTSFCYAINKGERVKVVDLNGNDIGYSSYLDRVFLLCDIDNIFNSCLEFCFSDSALNNLVMNPNVSCDPNDFSTLIKWDLFDDAPIIAQIPEIGYDGVCSYFCNKAVPQKYQDRARMRMAEFLVRDAVPLRFVTCIVVPNDEKERLISRLISDAGINIPVYQKPECFVR